MPLRSEHELRSLALDHGQEHVFEFWGELDAAGRQRLLEQLEEIDFALIGRLADEHLSDEGASPVDLDGIEPAPAFGLPTTPDERSADAAARELGVELIAAGKVAALIVAGGQGSRLGFEGPKGIFPIGPVSDRTLFRILAEKILATARRHGTQIPLFVMVSETNHDDTRRYFERERFFDLGEENVRFFQQEMLPAIDGGGKFLLAEPGRVATSPNGHGGSLKALHDSGCLAEVRRRGIELISYVQVDNPMVSVCDPRFLGHHARAGAEMSTKVLRKRDPGEKVGVLCSRDGRALVVEYSDLPDDLARATLPDGSLKFWAGSIGVHVFSVAFVERLNEGGFHLPYHVARKAVPHVPTSGASRGELVRPAEPNAIKLETFVFDALLHASETVSLEVHREEEFSPVKNAAGRDSPEQCRRDMTTLALSWLESCGARIERAGDGSFDGFVEISPLTALDAEELKRVVKAGTVVRGGYRI